jgi:uncharacterized protein YaaW (UPF0174 family)
MTQETTTTTTTASNVSSASNSAGQWFELYDENANRPYCYSKDLNVTQLDIPEELLQEIVRRPAEGMLDDSAAAAVAAADVSKTDDAVTRKTTKNKNGRTVAELSAEIENLTEQVRFSCLLLKLGLLLEHSFFVFLPSS